MVINVNLKGVFLGCQYAIPALLRAGGGSIINTASFVAIMGAAVPQIAYTASKGGVLAMTREIAVEFARKNIRANSLCPGPVETPLLAELLADPARRNRRLVHIPHGPLRARRGDGQRRAVPRQRRVVVHHRHVVPRRRRDHGGVHHAGVRLLLRSRCGSRLRDRLIADGASTGRRFGRSGSNFGLIASLPRVPLKQLASRFVGHVSSLTSNSSMK